MVFKCVCSFVCLISINVIKKLNKFYEIIFMILMKIYGYSFAYEQKQVKPTKDKDRALQQF